MSAPQMRVLITGGAGGIGRAIAAELLGRGACVLLVDRDEARLAEAMRQLERFASAVQALAADLTSHTDRERAVLEARRAHGGINVLVNGAGLNHFGLLEEQSPEQIALAFAVNVQAPIQLCRALLPHLQRQPRAAILNVGSVFGAIGYPGYVVYSATKFALRGFSEALRRELAGSTVAVHYLAPRATRTPINPDAVERMNAELGVAMDTPERVARAACALLEHARPASVVGWPEKLFVRINAVLPGLVDRSIRRQLPVIRRHAGANRAAAEAGARPLNR